MARCTYLSPSFIADVLNAYSSDDEMPREGKNYRRLIPSFTATRQVTNAAAVDAYPVAILLRYAVTPLRRRAVIEMRRHA